MKDQTVRRVLKDNKVPGTRAAEAPGLAAGSAARFLGERQAGLCERPGACLDQGGLLGGISRKEKEKIEALISCLENSPQQLWPPQPLECEHWISSPSTHPRPGSVRSRISGLADPGKPSLKHLGRNTSQLAPVHRALQDLLTL